ncbi:antirepressor protein [Streptococcus phage CHPC1033]|uniref:Antirepressor protein n=2 Tax=Moineauvirus TaxID=1623304 RepID=A0A3G8FCV9_9CAUD|nr:antirepressor protein [Streptococcus phage CHPC1033]AZF91440.1 antirepressor protein [Streptococcus phage CHPC1040]AZF92595.1 antirepressor protein [Streptococcus phage CHPC1033]
MSKKKSKKDNVLIETVKMQGEQAMQLVKQAKFNQNLLDEVIGLKDEMDRNVRKTNQKLTDIELLVEEVNKKVHIDDGEASKIKSIIFKKAGVFADFYFKEQKTHPSDNLFASKKGQFIRLMYSHLKKEFNVTKYTNIKHVEAEKAIKFLESLSYDDFTPFEIRETPKQKEIIALEKMSD